MQPTDPSSYHLSLKNTFLEYICLPDLGQQRRRRSKSEGELPDAELRALLQAYEQTQGTSAPSWFPATSSARRDHPRGEEDTRSPKVDAEEPQHVVPAGFWRAWPPAEALFPSPAWQQQPTGAADLATPDWYPVPEWAPWTAACPAGGHEAPGASQVPPHDLMVLFPATPWSQHGCWETAPAQESEGEAGRKLFIGGIRPETSSKDPRGVTPAEAPSWPRADAEAPEGRESAPTHPVQEPEGAAGRKLFIGGIKPETSSEDLRGHFAAYGPVHDAVVMWGKERPRGFGFVTFRSQVSASKALKADHILHGRLLDVKRAVPREALRGTRSSPGLPSGELPQRTPRSARASTEFAPKGTDSP